MDSEKLHEHHRKRMREKYFAAKDAMPDHEILEILLFSAQRRVNTNSTAHRLLRRFGSIKGVLDADYEELLKVEGVGASTAFLLKQLPYLLKRYEGVKRKGVLLDSLHKIGRYLVTLYRSEPKEGVWLLFLDASATLIECVKLAEGSPTASDITAREVAQLAFRHNASRVIMAHNHPGGVAEPTEADITATRFLRRALLPLDITLEEHFIIADNAYCPLVQYLQTKFSKEKGF